MNRRNVLKGLSGATVSLPWLEAVADRKTKKKQPPRTAFLFMPNGINPHLWTPEKTGESYETTEILKPMETVRGEFDILTNLGHKKSRHGDGHYAKTANYLSGEKVQKSNGSNMRCGTSADQIIAKQIGDLTPLPSLELGIQATSTATGEFTQIYGGHISWSHPTKPLPKEIYPQLAFDRLFSSGSNGKFFNSILDDIRSGAKKLDKYLGTEDRQRMDEFFTSIRAMELRIKKAVKANEGIKIPVEQRPEAGKPKNMEEHMRVMLDIIILAFQMRRTNVATFMFGNAVNGSSFSFLEGVDGGFHQLSHHGNKEDKLKMYGLINKFHIKLYSEMLLKMCLIKEGDKTLLDNSLVMFGSGLRDGNKHSPKDLPILIAGKGGQKMTRGKHRVFPEETPLCNLLLGMMQASGVEQESFGDSTSSII
ncbi:MAG: DUF1552 domain-containing protein [Lentisphaeraceae bacterium]|nr:DUF1552 domain-containing protein [Lentisphaeraceae bacterium]